MKTHKILVLVLVILTNMITSLVAQTNGGMKLVQGGTFTMGNTNLSKKESWNEGEFPAHTVTVSSFYVSEQPITLEQWMDRLNKYPYGYLETYNKITVQGDSFIYPDNYGKPDNSKFVPRAHWKFTAAANITWFDALTYCNRRSLAEGLTPCYASNGSTDAVTNPKYFRDKKDLPNITCDWNANGYRLPTEAEWEYVARKGVLRNDYPYNGGEWASDKYEWVWDWYSTTYYQMSGNSTNPRGPVYGEIQYSSGGRTDRREVPCRVIRGPISNPSSRGALDPGDYEIMVGPHPIAFRVVRNAQ